MIRALVVAALLTTSTPAAAQYGDDEWVCTASAKGSRGAGHAAVECDEGGFETRRRSDVNGVGRP